MPKQVLLIDYEPRSVERLQTLLSPEFSLTVARDGEEGLSLFSSGPRFEVVLVAGMLPRLASGEVIREIRRKGGVTAPPILLMVTGYKGSNPKADAQKVGAFDILVKPFSDDDLRAAVRNAIDATDIGAKTVRIPTLTSSEPPAGLTASDIFSDVLKDVAAEVSLGRQSPAPARAVPAPTASRPAESDVEKRLRDTLSGILGVRGTVKTPPAAPSGTPPPAPPQAGKPASHAKFSADADIDRMISDTLSGLPAPPRARPSSDRTPPPAVPPPPKPAPPEPPKARATAAPPRPPPSEPRPAEPRPAPPRAEPVRVPEPPPVSSGPDRFGQYEILERIASGGMAELYKARRSGVEGFEKIVAIKKILPHLADNEAFIGMFADEAKLAAQLNHPNIVHIYDLGKIDGGGYFIAMEYVEGRDLRAILESARELSMPLPVPLALYIGSKVASALDYAHRRRDNDGRDLHIVHRDVSPQNILISFEGDIKLCDFGIAKAVSKVSKTESGALKGKIQYMSPEQAWGKPIDRRSDLFSLGAVLYELLTEQKLFRGDSDLTILEKVRAAVVPAPSSVNPEVPGALDTIVTKTLAREPEERYANASDLLRDLESVLYSYTPAPGSADLAIFLHRLQAEEAAVAEAKAREAARAVPEAEVEAKPRRAKAAPVARRTSTQTTPPAPEHPKPAAPPAPPRAASPRPAEPKPSTAPGIYGAYPERRVESEGKSRTALYATIAVAVVLLGAGGYWMATRKPEAAPTPRPTALPVTAVPAAPVPTAAPTIDPKKVEEEVQRQLVAKKKELQKGLDAGKKAAAVKETALAAPPTEVAAAAAEPTAPPLPTPVPVARIEPTEPPAEPPPPTAAPVRAAPAEVAEPAVKRGDLVGPGPGVVEPVLVVPPKVVYPEIARQQGVQGGRVVVLVLVDEDGAVAEARLQQGLSPRSGINEAVIAAIRKSRFRPATKNGIPVKMWRPVVIEVKP